MAEQFKNVALTFGYEGTQPNFKRDQYTTLAEMKAVVDTIDEGHISYNLETKKHYVFRSTHEVNETTGKWKELNAEAEQQFTAEEVADLKARFVKKTQFEIKSFEVREAEGGTEQNLMAVSTAAGSDVPGEQEAVKILDKAGAEKILGVSDLKETIDSLKTNTAKAVEVESQGLVHTIKYGGTVVGTISIPKDVFVSAFSYDAENKKLKITVGENTLEVPVADFVKDYTAGTGISIEGNQFSIESGLKANIDKIPALEQKITALESRPNYDLGFAASGNKLAVAQEGNKLYVEVPASLNQKVFIVTEEEFNRLKNADGLISDAMYFLK